jgi:hypothetical protein
LLAAGPARLNRLITTTSRDQLGQAKSQALRTAATEAVALWDGDSAALDDLAAEVASEVRLVRAAETERPRHEHARDAAFAPVDPAGLAASLPGLGPVGTTQLVAVMGRPGRFPNAGAFKAFTGLTPRTSETGQTDRKHQPMTKAGPRALRSQLVKSADTARKLDPQLAAVYHAQMTQRGAAHRKALCVVGARLAERAWLTMARGEPYIICDLDGRPVTPEQAKRLIAERFTVTPEVRRRRRSTKKAGKAPHTALKAQGKSQRKAGHEATFPAASLKAHPSPSTWPAGPLDTPASLGNQPRRRPPSQQRAVGDRAHPPAHRPHHPRLRPAAHHAGQKHQGDHALPQALPRTRAVPPAPRRPPPRSTTLVDIGASNRPRRLR